MISTKDDTISGIDIEAGFSAGRCHWNDSVCVDKPTHFVTLELAYGTDAELYCIRHYVLTLARLCQVHLQGCEGDFKGHVANHGPIGS